MSARQLPVVAAVMLLCACEREPAERAAHNVGAAEAPCPGMDFVEEAHAAAFFFQNGTPERGRAHLAAAVAVAPDDGEGVELLRQLTAIRDLQSSDPNGAALQTEYVRAFLSDWRCLPPDVHERLHEALPPIPR